MCLLDQSAAYDLLCHNILKEKLGIYKFDSKSIDWIMSYLGDRSQCVQIESKISEPLQCSDHGVPQGSVLGGLLHLINSNDFPACHQSGESVVYVDDDTDYVHEADPIKLKALIEQEAANSANWLRDNRLCVAGDKSKLLIIGTKQLKKSKVVGDMTITIDGKQVCESSSEKLLGVTIDNKLTWKAHLYGDNDNDGLLAQLSKRVGILTKLSKHMNKSRLKEFAAGMFYSKLNYCLPVYGHVFGLDFYKERNNRYSSFTTSDNRRLQVLQNKVNRLITGADKRTSTSNLLEMTDSLSVQQMIGYQTLIMTYKILDSKKPVYLANRICKNQSMINLRSSKYVNQPNYKLSLTNEGFIARGQALMNKLDASIRNEKSLLAFKFKTREWVKKFIPEKPRTRI